MRKIFVASLILAACVSCTKRIYVPVEAERVIKDSTMFIRNVSDTVRERDSIMICVRGDTVIKEAWRMRERVSLRRDTLYIARHDTIRQPMIVEVEKEAAKGGLSRWIWPVVCLALLAITAGLVFGFHKK